MSMLTRNKFLQAQFDGDDDDGDYDADYHMALRRYYAEKWARLISYVLCFGVMAQTFLQVTRVFTAVMP